MQPTRKAFLAPAALLLLFFVLVPLLPVSLPFIFYMVFWITLASSFNIIYGFVGYLPFGYVMFYGIGAYVTAILWSRFHVPIPLGIACAGLVGGMASIIFAPTLRLKGIYFAIVNFSCAMVLRIVVANLPEKWAGGSFGITLSGAYQPIPAYYLMVALMTATVIISLLLSQSRLGIALRCIRDDEAAAEAMGINVPFCRLKAWLIASIIPSMAGGVEAWYTAIIDPNTSFNMMITAKAVMYSMFGGLGTVTGPVVGAVLMYSLDDFIWGRFPLLNLMILGFMITFLVLFLPRGIVGSVVRSRPSLRQVIE
jgi:branched-chain amino acid transport system permease protein